MGRYRLALAGLLLLIFVSSCSINYDEAMIGSKILENTPDTILYSFIYTDCENGHKNFSIYADKAETFDQKQQTVLKGLVFQQFDDNNNVISEGKAYRGIIFTESNNVEITGNLVIYSSREESRINTSGLYWDNDTKTLTGKPDKAITITKDSGTIIRGKGFTGNMKEKIYTLTSDVSGEYVYEEN